MSHATGSRATPAAALGIAILLAASGLAAVGPDLEPVTRDHLLSKIPNFFYYDYPYGPVRGKRVWLRVDDSTFIDRLPDGSEMHFKILGRAKIREMDGVIVEKTGGKDGPGTQGFPNDRSFQIFVPDKDAKPRAVLFRHLGGPELPEWRDMSWSDNKITELQKVE